MKYLKIILALVLVFAAGGAVGAAGTRAFMRYYVRQAADNPEFFRKKVERDLAKRLKLDAVQREKVRQALGQGQRELRDLRQEFRPRYEGILRGTAARISAELTPEQRREFEQMQMEKRLLRRPR